MNRKDAMSTALVVAILAAEYLFLRTWTGSRCASTCTNRMKYGFSSKKVLTCPLVLPPAAGNRHNFRVANEQVYEYDQLVAVKFDELSERKASADDKELVDLVKEIIDLPSGKSGTKLSHTARWTPQSIFVKNYFSSKRNGKFIDVGSYDGEVASNSVALEKYLNWTGLLSEPDPNYYTIMMGKNRQVYSINGCLSPKNYFSKMIFKDSDKYFGGQFGKLVDDSQPGRKVPCYPFETLMQALGWTEVDYFSLDVQGLELEILKTVPWDKIKIKVVSVEFGAGKATKDDYINFMKSKGYNFKEELKSNDEKMHVYVNDLMFVKE